MATLFYLLTIVICSSYVALLISYLYAWVKTPSGIKRPSTIGSSSTTFASILIPARNEEFNILNCLSSIYRQTHSLKNFEVIVIDDHSTDRTRELVESQKYQNLRIIRLSENQNGKKQAITEGVRIAHGNLIVTTDADCEAGEKWLSEIISFYEEKKPKMIVAPVLLNCKKREKIQHKVHSNIDFLPPTPNSVTAIPYSGLPTFSYIMQSQEMTALTASACAALYGNYPLLCSGANLVYEKSVFLAVNGYEGVDKTATGDDIFLMLKIHKKFPKQICYLKSKEAIVFTQPERSSVAALQQRKRWASKNFSYGFSYVTWVAALVFFTNFLIFFSGIMSAINPRFALVSALCFFAKVVVDYMFLRSASSFWGRKIHIVTFVFASFVYPVYVSFTGLLSPFVHYSWKGRKF